MDGLHAAGSLKEEAQTAVRLAQWQSHTAGNHLLESFLLLDQDLKWIRMQCATISVAIFKPGVDERPTQYEANVDVFRTDESYSISIREWYPWDGEPDVSVCIDL